MTRRLVAILIGVLLAVLAAALTASPPLTSLAQEQPACTLCAGEKSFTCPTCEGLERAVQTCLECDGTRKRTCQADHPKTRKVVCPNPLCNKGKVSWDDGKKHDCKLCGTGGLVPCRECALVAKQSCEACGPDGTALRSCDDCIGTGKLDCLLCGPTPAAGASAALTLGRGPTATCPQCKGTKKADQKCAECDATGEAVCTVCSGLAETACETCAATGKARGKYDDGTTAYTKSCGNCDKAGVRECGKCEDGVAACVACDGRREGYYTCSLCVGEGVVQVYGRGRAVYDRLEVQAEVLAGRGATADAIQLYESMHESATTVAAWYEDRVKAMKKEGPTKGRAGALPADMLEKLKESLALLHARMLAVVEAEGERASDAVARASKALQALKSK